MDILFELLTLDFEGTCQDISSAIANRQAHTSILQVYYTRGAKTRSEGRMRPEVMFINYVYN
jgi:hypothetical protein